MKVAPGTTLGRRYRVDAKVGSGGMGTVFRGRDLQLGREVAIKVLSSRVHALDGAIARFEREARVGAQLSHPHIIQTLDFGLSDGVRYLVLQLVTGGDLRQYQESRGRLSVQAVCEIGYQLADALAAAHAVGIVHRDLKPENVLVDPQGSHLWIADFGLAYLAEAADPRDGRLTRDGEFGGTPMYVAPEQVANQQVGPAVDVYALGCVLFELATGAPPFQGSPASLLAKQLYAAPPRLSASRPDAPSGLDELVERMLAKTPAGRPPADAVRHRLAVLLGAKAHPHERARDVSYASDRDARMITVGNSPTEVMYRPDPEAGETSVFLGLQGALGGDALTALRVAGFAIGSESVVAWIAIGQPLAEIRKLMTTGLPVIADSPRLDLERVAQLVKIGVAEVLVEPLLPHVIVRKVQRALHTARRAHDRT